ncbi:MAG: error-prone DNA polymerase [Bacteriovoracia bacterium]
MAKSFEAYAELLSKSNFSFLLGASHPDELVEEAINKGLYGLALNDLNGVYGVVKGYRRAKEAPEFKYIASTEVSFIDHPNLVLLPKNKKGYGQICQILTHAFKEKGVVSLSFFDFVSLSKDIQNDVVVLIRDYDKTNFDVLKELYFNNIYLPLTRYLDGKDKERTSKAILLSKQFEIPIVASNDIFYHEKSRKIVQDVLISIKETKSLDEIGYKLFPNAERYLKTPRQMSTLFSDIPHALRQSVVIAEQCHFSLSELRYYYPSEWIPNGHTAQSYLEYLVSTRAPLLYKNRIPEAVQKQLKHELKLISELKYADYFLTIYDIVEFARKKEILCQGRGSAANSAVCFVLGITSIDPVQMNLLFERFISAERGEPPDIDVDFEHERREEVIQYIYQKYGRNRAGMVSAVITYQKRSAFREVCKAFGVPIGTLSAKKIERRFEELTENLPHPVQIREKINKIADIMDGFPRHLSIHSGGFTLSADPITSIAPVEPARMPNRTIVQWDKYDLDTLGLLKVDVLSLGMLSALRKTLNLVGKQLHEITHDDKPTYQMIQQCDTVGTFQIESRAQMSMLGRLLPKNFYDLVIEVAIVRPGPIVGKMVHPYLKRRRGIEKITFPNEKVRNILGKTLGIPLFQEQIMKLAIDLANFSPGEADLLRRSINAWRTSAPISKMAKRLMDGLIEGGLPKAFAEQIFSQIQGFSQYGFPESHAASFALLAYASCYLKCHYPAEFTCSLINSQPLGFYRNDTLLYDAIRHGVDILPISFNQSQWDCTIEKPNTIRLGFRVVKGIAKSHVEHLIEERTKRAFQSFSDICSRTKIRHDVLDRIAMAGGFSEFNLQPRQALWALIEYENLFEKTNEQLSLFKENYTVKQNSNFKKLSSFERIQEDYDAYSLSTHGHPMSEVRKQVKGLPKTNSKILRTLRSGTKVSACGLILVRQKPPTAKGTVFSTLEDEFGFIDLILHKDVYERSKEIFLIHCFIKIQGTLQRDTNTVSILVEKVAPVWNTSNPNIPEDTPLFVEPTQYFY